MGAGWGQMSQVPERDSAPATDESILKPGSNCWKLEEARRLAVLVDTADYLRLLPRPASRQKVRS